MCRDHAGNLFLNLFTFPCYADYSWVSDFIAKSVAEPRWLIHLRLQTAVFHTLESMFFARAFMPNFVHDPLSLARALNVLLVLAIGAHCYAFYPKLRETIVWVVSSGAYCFMATGYGKVYGAATALLLLLYCSLADSEFEGDGITLGVVSAFVGLYYLALLPIALGILIALLIKRTRAFLPALLSFVVAGYVFISIFWGQNVASYFGRLWTKSHFGNQFTAYAPYQGQASSGNSIFFKLSFVFSVKHFTDMLYMLFFSGTLLSLGGACYELGRSLFEGRRLLERLRSVTPTAIFSAWGFGTCILILFGYLSKIGPRGDLPFSSPYIVPFTFAWLQLRRQRLGAEFPPRLILAGHYAYMVVIVIWSGIVGPPEI